MCGIFGCVGKLDNEKAMQCVTRIKHRGPDALKVQELEGVTLAHARLSIIDISDEANQPFGDSTGRYWIVFNGEIYNFVELREELKLAGCKFRTQSDTEVLLYAYITWGEKFQEKCNGMWALAIWDSYERKLFLSRDRFGIKPLFLFREGENLYFASEMKAFFSVMKERVPNYHLFDNNDYFKYEATRECTIKGIEHFPAGYCATYDANGKYNEYQWWNTLEHLIDVPENYNEQVEYFRELFLDSCRIRMRSDVPLGTALSGGIDSSAVLGAMYNISQTIPGQMNQDWQNAFVASMPNTAIDETEYAEIAAKHVGLNVKRVMVNPKISVDELMQYIYMCEEPYCTSPIPFIQTYKAIRDSGVKVTLDGHGADELFGGYDFDFLLSCMDAGMYTQEFYEVLNTYNDSVFEYKRITDKEAVRRTLTELALLQKDAKKEKGLEGFDWLNRKLYLQTHKKVLPTILRCYDRYSMSNGLEIRMPFMDYRIVCFAFSIPWNSKVKGGYSKAIVRDMARPFMTDKILNRKDKIGFNSPLTEWFKGELREFLLDTVHTRDFLECGLINSLEVTVLINELLNSDDMRFDSGAKIWESMIPYLWKKAVIDNE